MGATEGSATVPVMGGDPQETTELNLFFHRLDAVDPSHPPPRPSSDASPIASSSPTPLLNAPSSATSQTMLSEQTVPRNVCRMCCSAVEHLPADGKVVVPALWKTTCLVPVPKKQASKDSVTTDKALTSPAMKALEMLVLKYL